MRVNIKELYKVLEICKELDKLGNLKCLSCGEKLDITHVKWKKQRNFEFWVYLECPYCGYETALWKLFMHLRRRRVDEVSMKWKYTPIMEQLKEHLNKTAITEKEYDTILYYADIVLRETYDNPRLIGKSRKTLSAGLFYALIKMLINDIYLGQGKVAKIFGVSEPSVRHAYKLWIKISPTLKLSIEEEKT